MLKGRLGLESARVPHSDRHGIMWLGRGNLYVESGTLRFVTAGYGDLGPGELDGLLRQAGLAPVSWYGSWNLDPLGCGDRVIVLSAPAARA